ncbi:microtubule-associated protein 10 [Sorex fumeus]|uniref:microtubule-associated protein 10 n=1 Tax=Sorex fumeus TaxID=62283 RepID=UPI0024AD16E1|nr:microtubule-associated protein 10 [Sorex fumeus]
MAASVTEQLFSLELLVDWVHLEVGKVKPPAFSEKQGDEEGTSSLRRLCPVVAFRLLDFPTLLVYPPGGPAAPAPEPRPGLFSFGRGKSCLFRLHPATLHRSLLRTPLYTLLLHLPPGLPTPAPQLLGSSSISLAAAAHKILGAASSGSSQGDRRSFPLHNQVGECLGSIALGYRLTALESSLLGHLQRPVTYKGGEVEGVELQKTLKVSSQTQQKKHQPASELPEVNADGSQVDLKIPKAPKNSKEVVLHNQANSDSTGSVENSKINGVCANVRSVSTLGQEVTELDIETNIICPPPLYYTNFTLEKAFHVPGKITIKPQTNLSEELNDTFPEEKLVSFSTCVNSVKHTNFPTPKSPPVLLNPPNNQDIGTTNQTTYQPQTEQNRIGSINQLPMLNALLVELSLLLNQPMADPLYVHPQLAWLYSSEHKRLSESSAKSAFEAKSRKDKLSVGANEKAINLQHKKNQVENLKDGKYFQEKNVIPKRVPRGKLFYGLTNTLKLRLKQTNPAMLAVHEKREQYRKMQAQMLGAKLRMPSSKAFSIAKQHQKQHQPPRDKDLESDASFVKYSDTSKQVSGGFDDPSLNKENKLNHATEETVDCGKNRTNDTSLEEIVSSANSVVPHTNISETKMIVKAESPCGFRLVAVDRIVVDRQINDGKTETMDNEHFYADMTENEVSKNSSSENISLKYSDDFTSPYYSEDFYSAEDTSRILSVCDSSSRTEGPKHSQYKNKSSVTRLSRRENSSEKSSIISPPFSAGSPVHSKKSCYISKTQDRILKEASSSDLSSSLWTEENKNQEDQNNMHNSKFIRSNQDISVKLKTIYGCKSLERSQSPQTSQVSSYMPPSLSELKFNILDFSSTSDNLEEDSDEVGSLNISKQCKDICELVINKLPGYTM